MCVEQEHLAVGRAEAGKPLRRRHGGIRVVRDAVGDVDDDRREIVRVFAGPGLDQLRRQLEARVHRRAVVGLWVDPDRQLLVHLNEASGAVGNLALEAFRALDFAVQFLRPAADEHFRRFAVADDPDVTTILDHLARTAGVDDVIDATVGRERGKLLFGRARVALRHGARLVDQDHDESGIAASDG